MRFRSIGIVPAAAVLAMTFSTVVCAETVLSAASAFPQGHRFSQKFERFIEIVNQRSKGTLVIDYKGGAPAIGSPFTLGQRTQRGQFDVMTNTGPYYESTVPEALGLMLAERPIQELRSNGAVDLIKQVHEAKGLVYLGRTLEFIPFHLYLRKPIEKADLNGLRIRVAPHYQPFFGELGATTVRSDLSEIYTFMENGTIEGFGWPVQGLLPDWLKVTKYRLEPGFYDADMHIVLNLATWKKLTPQHQKLLQDLMIEFEAANRSEAEAENAASLKQQGEAGIQALKLNPAETEKWRIAAVETAWKAVIERSPDAGPKLRKLMTKQ